MERLDWHNRFVKRLVQTLETYNEASCENPTPLVVSGEDNIIVLRVSLDEWRKLYSSVFTGSDICYPDESDSVRWILTRAVECPVSICEMIIDCIENDTDVQNALAAFLASHANGTQYPVGQQLPSGVASGNVLSGNEDCDPDVLWSQCIGLVQTANRMTVDFLETWETYTNTAEIADALVDAVPLVSLAVQGTGVPGLISYANTLIDSIAENYNADYTLEYEQQLACEIFCAAKDTCEVTIDMLCDVMNARIGNQLNLANAAELILSLIDADIGGFNVADLYLAFFFNALKIANLVVPIRWGIENFIRAIAVFNEPNDDWMILCEDCAEPETLCEDADAEFNFRTSENGFAETVPDYAQYHVGEGWGPNTSRSRIGIDRSITQPIARIVLKYTHPAQAFIRNKYTNGWASYGLFTAVLDEDTGLYVMDIAGLNVTAGLSIETIDFSATMPLDMRLREMCLYYVS